jgi:hypothetical protein
MRTITARQATPDATASAVMLDRFDGTSATPEQARAHACLPERIDDLSRRVVRAAGRFCLFAARATPARRRAVCRADRHQVDVPFRRQGVARALIRPRARSSFRLQKRGGRDPTVQQLHAAKHFDRCGHDGGFREDLVTPQVRYVPSASRYPPLSKHAGVENYLGLQGSP